MVCQVAQGSRSAPFHLFWLMQTATVTTMHQPAVKSIPSPKHSLQHFTGVVKGCAIDKRPPPPTPTAYCTCFNL
uniref:Putative secreted peptide n=1 Tax=Anopheles braziliensis TaxID=58242 RepID=A0A2M3ZW01_9DIPT